jgi:hypothetical protein
VIDPLQISNESPEGVSLEPHPHVERLIRFWRDAHPAEGILPGRQHVDITAIPDLLPYLWIFDIEYEPLRARLRLAGEGAKRFIPTLTKGRLIEAGHPNHARFAQVADQRRGSWRRGPTLLPIVAAKLGSATIESIFLPLATDGRQIDAVTGLTLIFDRNGKRWT